MAAGVKSEPYTKDMLRLAGDLEPFAAIEGAGEATVRSPACGSVIRCAVRLDGEVVAGLALDVSACAYGQAAARLVQAHGAGRSVAEVQTAHDAIAGWLADPQASTPDWPDIEKLAPARERPGRHGAVLLPWRAMVAAAKAAS